MVLIDMAQRDEVPTLTSIVSESMPHLKRGAIKDFKAIMMEHEYWEEERWNASDFHYTFPLADADGLMKNWAGSKIEFFSADQPGKVRGPRRDRLFMNEANRLPLETFEQLEVRTKEFVYLDWNPDAMFWWEDMEDPDEPDAGVRDREDAEEIVLTYLDNEGLSPEIVASIEKRKKRKGWWKVYGLGEYGEVAGRIYTGWKMIDEIPHEAKLVRIWVDFGYSNDPASIGAVYSYNGGYILHEIAYATQMSNQDIADAILNYLDGDKCIVICDNSEPKSIDELKKKGLVALPCRKGKDSVNFGIKTVQDEQISITKESVSTIKEYHGYMWEVDEMTGKILAVPVDINNHSMDGIRYAIDSIIAPPKRGAKVNRPKYKGFNRRQIHMRKPLLEEVE
jgi:phage terminase large subunit